MVDFAILGFKVDSTPLSRAKKTLDDFAGAGKRADDAAKGLGESSRRAGATASTAFRGAPATMRLFGASAQGATARVDGLTAAFGRLRSVLGPLMGLFAAGALFGSMQEYVRLENQLKVLGLTSQEAAARLQQLSRVAADTRSSLSGTVQLYQRASMAARDLGANEAQVIQFTRAVGMAMAQTGTGGAAAEGAMVQLAQALGGTNIQAEEFNSLIDGAYPLVMAAARGIDRAGGSVGRLRTLVKEGEVTAKEFFDAIISQSGELELALASTSVTIGQAFGLLTDQITMAAGTFDRATGATNFLAQGLLSVAGAVQSLNTWMAEHEQIIARIVPYIGAAATAYGVTYATALGVTFVAAARQAIASQIALEVALGAGSRAAAMSSIAIKGLTVALGALRGAIIATGVGAIIVLMGELFYKVTALGDAFGSVRVGIGVFFEWWGHILRAGLAEIQAMVYGARAYTIELAISIEQNLRRAANVAIGALVGAYEAIKATWSRLPAAIGDVAVRAANAVISATEGMINGAIERMNRLIRGANSAFAWMGDWTQVAEITEVKLGEITNQWAGAAAEVMQTANDAYAAAAGQNYVGPDPTETWDEIAGTWRKAQDVALGTADAHRASAAAIQQGAQEIIRSNRAADDSTDATTRAAAAANSLGDELDGAGKKGKAAGEKAKKATDEVADAIAEAQKNINEKLISAIEGATNAFAEWTMRGFRDFQTMVKGIIDSFRQMLVQLIAMAAKNRIMVQMGLDPLSQSLSAAGVPGVGVHSGLFPSLIGSFQPGAGGFLGGIGTVGRGIAGGWATGGIGGALSGGLGASWSAISAGLGSGTLAGVATALGAAMPIIAGVAAVVSIGKKLFGRKLKDTGIEGVFEFAEGLAASTYKFYKGGLFRSDKTRRSALGAELANPLERSFMEIGTSVIDLTETLGASADAVQGLEWRFKFSTKGMSEEEIQRRLEEEFEKYADAAALAAIPEIERFSRSGEGAYETLQRLSVSLEAANTALEMIGQTAYEVSVVGADMATSLAEAFGSVEAMTTAVNNYFDKFYTDAEKRAHLMESATDVFAKHGRIMPATREEYRRMVDSLDLTTEAGRKAFAAFVGLSDVMDQLLPQIATFSEALLGAAAGVVTAADEQIAYAKAMSNELRKAASDWYGYAKDIRRTIRDMFYSDTSGATPADQLAAAAASYNRAVKAAKEGDANAAANVADLARTYVELLRENATSSREYALREASIRSELALVAGVAELTGASKDVQAQLYDQMVDVLEQMKLFLQMQGLSEEALAEFGDDVQALFRDFDGTMESFQLQVNELADAIEHAEGLTYETLLKQLTLNVDVIENSNLSDDVKRLLIGANEGITTAFDFLVRRDLPPDLKWLAMTQFSEHAKTVNLLVGRNLPTDLLKVTLAEMSKMVKTVDIVLGSNVSLEAKRIALAANSELARVLRVTISSDTNNDALRAILAQTGSITRTIRGVVDTGTLTAAQLSLLTAIGGASVGRITLGGTFQFDPSSAFQGWYTTTTRDQLTNPLNNLRTAIIALREQLAKDQADAEKAALVNAGNTLAERTMISAGSGKWIGTSGQLENVAKAMGIDTTGRSSAQLAHMVATKSGVDSINSVQVVGNIGAYLKSIWDSRNGFVPVDEADYKRLYPDVAANSKYKNLPGQVHYDDWGRQDMLGQYGNPPRPFNAQAFDWSAIGLNVPGFAAGGMHVGGLRVVGENGPELEATGPARIWNANQTSDLLGGRAMLMELRAVRDEIRRMRDETVSAQIQMAKQTRRTADTLRKWDIDGQPLERTDGATT